MSLLPHSEGERKLQISQDSCRWYNRPYVHLLEDIVQKVAPASREGRSCGLALLVYGTMNQYLEQNIVQGQEPT
jgi:hypothetical protein